jgi:hypothetical protein
MRTRVRGLVALIHPAAERRSSRKLKAWLTEAYERPRPLSLLALLVRVAPFLFTGTAVFFDQLPGLLRRRYCIYPVSKILSITAKLEDGLVHLPHPVMCKYRHIVSVVADNQIRGEAAVDLPSSFGEGLVYVLSRSRILSSLSSP